jgi:hypothetical protein
MEHPTHVNASLLNTLTEANALTDLPTMIFAVLTSSAMMHLGFSVVYHDARKLFLFYFLHNSSYCNKYSCQSSHYWNASLCGMVLCLVLLHFNANL